MKDCKKLVIDNNGELIYVEKDSIQCTVCGEWKSKEDYCKNLEGKVQDRMLRTNCFDCFNLSSEEFRKKDKEWENKQKSSDFKYKKWKAERDEQYLKNSYSKDDLLKIIISLDNSKRYIFPYQGRGGESYYYMTNKCYSEKEIKVDGKVVIICEL